MAWHRLILTLLVGAAACMGESAVDLPPCSDSESVHEHNTMGVIARASTTHTNSFRQECKGGGQDKPPPAAGNSTSVAVCLIVASAASYLREWVDYHRCIGVSKFYIYAHRSDPAQEAAVADHIDSGLVEYRNYSHRHIRRRGAQYSCSRFLDTPQGAAYSECLTDHAHKHDWMAFIDVDEFIVLNDRRIRSLQQLLQPYQDHGGLALYWTWMGPGSQYRQPTQGGVVSNYRTCLPSDADQHRFIKSIINTRAPGIMCDAHTATSSRINATLVDENFRRVFTRIGPRVSKKKAAIYHYVAKSLEEFKRKVKLGGGEGSHRSMSTWYWLKQTATRKCNRAWEIQQSCKPRMPAEPRRGIWG